MNIERINELAKKSREVGLTAEEKAEQSVLREEYIQGFRNSLIAELSNTYVVDEKGNKTAVKKKEQGE